jgi:hypothetical protein
MSAGLPPRSAVSHGPPAWAAATATAMAASFWPRHAQFQLPIGDDNAFEVFACEQASMRHPQPGIFALGTASHAYLEFDALDLWSPASLGRAIASLREPRTTMGGVNLVVGFRPELWREIAPDDAPSGAEGLNADLVGPDGYVMPATQHDAVLWRRATPTT